MTSDLQPASYRRVLGFPTYGWILPLALLIGAVMAFAIFQPLRVLPRISLAPSYSFIDQRGEKFTSESMRGNFVLYSFAAAGCVDPCLSTVTALASFQQELRSVPTGEIPLQFVAIFVDPEAATPAVLQRQARQVGAVGEQFHLVTGDRKELKQVIGAGFSTYYAQDGDGPYTVDPVFVLVDGWGIVRAVYRTPTPDVAILKRDLTLVAQEALNSTGVNRYAYEAAHLFLCYPK